ncbi:hypothetical protein LA07_01465, partial [Xanthomonas oryzae pv. oryzae]
MRRLQRLAVDVAPLLRQGRLAGRGRGAHTPAGVTRLILHAQRDVLRRQAHGNRLAAAQQLGP